MASKSNRRNLSYFFWKFEFPYYIVLRRWLALDLNFSRIGSQMRSCETVDARISDPSSEELLDATDPPLNTGTNTDAEFPNMCAVAPEAGLLFTGKFRSCYRTLFRPGGNCDRVGKVFGTSFFIADRSIFMEFSRRRRFRIPPKSPGSSRSVRTQRRTGRDYAKSGLAISGLIKFENRARSVQSITFRGSAKG